MPQQDYKVTVNDNQCVVEDPDFYSPPSFKIKSQNLKMKFEKDKCSIKVRDKKAGIRFAVRCEEKAVQYDVYGEPPEGFISKYVVCIYIFIVVLRKYIRGYVDMLCNAFL